MGRHLKRATGIVLGFALLLAGAGCDGAKNPWDDDFGDGAIATVTERIARKTYSQLERANGMRLAFDLTLTKEADGVRENRTLDGTLALFKDEDGADMRLNVRKETVVTGVEIDAPCEVKECEYSTYFIDDLLYFYDMADQTYVIDAAAAVGTNKADLGEAIERALAVTFGAEAEETVVLSALLGECTADFAAFGNSDEWIEALKSVLDKDGVNTAKTVEVSRKTVSPAGTAFDVESRFTTDAGLVSMNVDVDGVWRSGTEEEGCDLAASGTVRLDDVDGNAQAIDLPKDKAAFYEAEITVSSNSAKGIGGGSGTLSLTRKNGVLYYKLTELSLLVGRDQVVYELEGQALGGNAARFGLNVTKCEDRSESRDADKAVGKAAEVVVDYAAGTVEFTSVYIPPRLWSDFY